MKFEFFGSYQTDIDMEATQTWYARADEWACECGDCRNFLKQARERSLPAPVVEILDKLGVPPEKAADVCEYGPAEGGRLYEFCYRIAGQILSGNERASVSQGWGDGLCFHDSYPYGAPDFPEPHFDLGFWVTLPWVLDEPRE